jgi:hypothetical protein
VVPRGSDVTTPYLNRVRGARVVPSSAPAPGVIGLRRRSRFEPASREQGLVTRSLLTERASAERGTDVDPATTQIDPSQSSNRAWQSEPWPPSGAGHPALPSARRGDAAAGESRPRIERVTAAQPPQHRREPDAPPLTPPAPMGERPRRRPDPPSAPLTPPALAGERARRPAQTERSQRTSAAERTSGPETSPRPGPTNASRERRSSTPQQGRAAAVAATSQGLEVLPQPSRNKDEASSPPRPEPPPAASAPSAAIRSAARARADPAEPRSPRPEALEPLLARARAIAVGTAQRPAATKNGEAHTPRPELAVTVTIGRLEVRTQPVAAEPPAPPREPRRRPTSLDDHLRARSSGRSG